MVYHVVNRANGRLRLFRKDDDFLAFYNVLLEVHARHSIRILGWCLMANHWHFVVHPRRDGELSRFFASLGLTHATRWQVAHNAVGMGHVYQGRFRNFMIQEDEHLLSVLRYVERNPLRAAVVSRAQDWHWSSLHARLHGPEPVRDLLKRLADRPAGELGPTGESPANRCGGRSDPDGRPARPAAGERCVGGAGCVALRIAKHSPPARRPARPKRGHSPLNGHVPCSYPHALIAVLTLSLKTDEFIGKNVAGGLAGCGG